MTEYLIDGEWIGAAEAKRRVFAVASAFEQTENHSRARYCRENWQMIAARPAMFAEWRDLAETWLLEETASFSA